jgi:hypothetical protein
MIMDFDSDIVEKIKEAARDKNIRCGISEPDENVREILTDVCNHLGFLVFSGDGVGTLLSEHRKWPFDILMINWDRKQPDVLTDFYFDKNPRIILIIDGVTATFSIEGVSISGFLYKPFGVERVLDNIWSAIDE